jgi:hypothetical protein
MKGGQGKDSTRPHSQNAASETSRVPLACAISFLAPNRAQKRSADQTCVGMLNGERYSRVSMALAASSEPKFSALGSNVRARPRR